MSSFKHVRTKLPTQAYAAAKYIRVHVPRPDRPPDYCSDTGRSLRWRHPMRCPLGLIPGAVGTPGTTWGVFPHISPWDPKPLTDQQIRAFYLWWDRQTDGKWAMNQVWGPKRRRKVAA